MKKFKISQIQFEAKDTPFENAILLQKLFQKTSLWSANNSGFGRTPKESLINKNETKF